MADPSVIADVMSCTNYLTGVLATWIVVFCTEIKGKLCHRLGSTTVVTTDVLYYSVVGIFLTVWYQRRLDTIKCTTFFAELAQKLTMSSM